MKIIAHRGKCDDCEGNTIESVQKAIGYGVYGVEFDIQQTKDNRLVLLHDDNIAGIGINKLDYGDAYNLSESVGFELTVTEDVINICGSKIWMDIELKNTVKPETFASIVPLLNNLRWNVKSFHPHILQGIYNALQGVYTNCYALVIDCESKVNNIPDFISRLDIPKEALHHPMLPRLSKMKEIWIWTVSSKEEFDSVISSPYISGLITDYYPNQFVADITHLLES